VPPSERLTENLTLEPALPWGFDRELDGLCAELGLEWAALAMVRLSEQGLCGAWLASSGAFPDVSPPSARELVLPAERVAVLGEHGAGELRVWILPLASRRGTVALIAPRALAGDAPVRLQSLRASVAEYERLYLANVLLTAIDGAPDPIEISDREARLFYVNEAWRNYFNYGDAAVVSETVGALVRDDENPVHDSAYVQFTFSELCKRREWLGVLGSRSRDGQRRFNEAMVSPFDAAERSHHGNLAIRRDLSHRQNRDEALASAHREFRAVLAAMPDAVIVLRESVIYFANDAFSALVGRDRSEVIGMSFDSFVHLEDRGALESQRDAGWGRNVRLLHQSGALRIAEVSAAGDVSFEGSPSHILIARDVTERVLEREQLARSDRLAALGALAAGVAHEINNPLAYMLLNLETAQTHSDPSAREALDEAMDGARRIGAIVAELRGFWNGSGDALGAVDVTTAITSAINLVQNEIRHRAELVRQLEPGLLAFARHGQVVQVLVNLLVNAAQAIPNDQGRPRVVRVHSRAVSLTELEITVSDTGFGISPEMRDSLFEPSAPVSASGVSPGFGLAISKRIVQELNGSISVSETGPAGTTLEVRLPRLPQEEQQPDSRKSHYDLLQSPYRVLVVDDEPMLARAVKRALDPFVVHVASDGQEALAVLESEPEFDVILCDLMMPRISGADLFRRISLQNPHLSKRFVFMTGGAFADWSQRFLDTVDRPIIEKPFQPAQLRKCIESVARQARRSH
jgi:PAS domain S-box-containing protein